MLVFLDTEFTGLDQKMPDLISIGLVDEVGREFYAELPETNWTVQCNEWVHFNVVPHLQRGGYVDGAISIGIRLKAWIESYEEEIEIVSDWPQGDFFIQLKRLLPSWPRNLNPWPIHFNSWSMGDEFQPTILALINENHSEDRPLHHALYDAHSLRLAFLYAVQHGWSRDR